MADGQWHYYEWGLDTLADWAVWRDRAGTAIAGDGVIATSGNVSVDSIWLGGGEGTGVEYFFDTIMFNRSGSLAAMMPSVMPEPAALLATLVMLPVLCRRR